MRRKIETEERDSTSRASFKCTACEKTFTDLEADQLVDFVTGEFRCSFCDAPVEEDESALPKTDSRLLLARFNEQIEPLYNLLREVDDIKLAPEILEPEPTDMTEIKKYIVFFILMFNCLFTYAKLYFLFIYFLCWGGD